MSASKIYTVEHMKVRVAGVYKPISLRLDGDVSNAQVRGFLRALLEHFSKKD